MPSAFIVKSEKEKNRIIIREKNPPYKCGPFYFPASIFKKAFEDGRTRKGPPNKKIQNNILF